MALITKHETEDKSFKFTSLAQGEDKAADLLAQNIDFPLFKKKAIEEAMANKEYDCVEREIYNGENLVYNLWLCRVW